MKFILAVLLILNLSLYSAWQGWLGQNLKRWVAFSEAEPARLLQQVQPERLQVLVPGLPGSSAMPAPATVPLNLTSELAPAKADATPATSAAVATVAPVANPIPASFVPPVVSSAAADSAALKCVELGAFNSNDAQSWSEKLTALGLSRVSQRLAAPVNGFMVYLPNESRAARDKKIQEIRALNETDLATLQENSPLSNAISLGIFSSQEAASARITALTKKGIVNTRVIQRGEKSPRSFVQVFNVEEAQRSALESLAKEAGLPWRNCPAS